VYVVCGSGSFVARFSRMQIAAFGSILLVLIGCVAPMTPATQEAVASMPLQETEWRLIEVEGETAIRTEGERQPHLRFLREESRLTGFTGCNTLSGQYELSGDSLRIPGPLATTRMACLRPDLNEQEQKLTGLLGSVRRYTISGRTLTLHSDKAVLARFEAAS
jgi:heat shock protein HslJ